MQPHVRQLSGATAASIALHIVIIVALALEIRFPSPDRAAPAQAVAIEALVVDETLVQQEIDRMEQLALAETARRDEAEQEALRAVETAQREREREEARLETLREQTEAAERAEAERQAALLLQREQEAAEQREREAAAELERQRLEELEQQRQAEEARLAREREAEAERQRQEQERLEQERAEEAERQRLQAEAEAAERARLEEELFAAIAQEEAVRQARDSGLLDEYIRSIENRIQQRWIRPPSAREGLECVVNVTQIPSGEVTGAVVGQCNGDDAVRRSIETAVLRASPLPRPPVPALFDRNLIITFTPDD